MDRSDQVAHRPSNQVPDGKVSHAAALLLGLTEQSKQRLHRADEVKLQFGVVVSETAGRLRQLVEQVRDQ